MITIKGAFDDSGTHANSNVVVVGGLLGSVAQWTKFQNDWATRLADPLPGSATRPSKPPLSMFHLAACNAREGEFASYNEAEQNEVIYAFRKILIDSKLTATASAVDRRAWDELVVGPYREILGDALSACVENCVSETVRIVEPRPDGHNVALVFDRGIMSAHVQEITESYTYPLARPRIVSVNFLKVKDHLPLQGADIVATESYWHAAEWLKYGDEAKPRPHLRHFLDNMLTEGLILTRDAIVNELRRRGPDGRILEGQPS
jgi:hypothetical protein